MLTRLIVVLALVSVLFTLPLSPSLADTASDIKSLQAAVAALQSTVSSQAATIADLGKTVRYQKGLLEGFSRVTDTTRTDGRKGTELYIIGRNMHIVNGLGATDGDPTFSGTKAVNGLGNVIIGYNGSRDTASSQTHDIHSGSHNLILGDGENYSSYGGIVAGLVNTISGPYACVSGGADNVASGGYASVSGGARNMATNEFTAVSGGESNVASGFYSSVSGGKSNTVDGLVASISGGMYVKESDSFGFAAGGDYSASSPGPGTFHSP